MRLPTDRLREGVAVQALPGVVGHGGRHQHLSRSGQAGDAGGQIDGESLDARMRTIAIGVWTFTHLAHVQSDAYTRKVRFISMHLLEPQREQDRRAGRLAGQKATVTGPIDDATA